MNSIIQSTIPIKENKKDEYQFPHWQRFENGEFLLSSQCPVQTEKIEDSSANQCKDNKKPNIVEFNDDYKQGMFVMTEWGPGKIASVNNAEKTCNVKIEDTEVGFAFDALKASLNIYLCIIDKSKTYWAVLNVQFTDTVKTIRMKIGKILNVHFSQIILVRGGQKLKNNDKTTLDLELFEKDEMLVVVKDEVEKRHYRFKSEKCQNLLSNFNAIGFKSSEDIYLTAMDLFRNAKKNIFYEIKILDDKKKVIYKEQGIEVEKQLESSKNGIEKSMKKYDFDTQILIKKNTNYEIQQKIFIPNENPEEKFFLKEQIVGYTADDSKSWDKSDIKFFNIESDDPIYNRDSNVTSVNQGLIPSFYYIFKV